MAFQEIPMLRCSTQFKDRLIDACRRFDEPEYFFRQRVNWSYKFSDSFLKREVGVFSKNPEKYIARVECAKPEIDDIYEIKLSLKQTAVQAVKVAAHWSFRCFGCFASLLSSTKKLSTYRKAYVDDIEQVFEADQIGVLRVVYPFPLSVRRQWKYFRYLISNNYRFRLGGHPYTFIDFVRFLWKRDVDSLQVMETRAQLLHAKTLVEEGFVFVQLSDEFDVGSLVFSRMLRRCSVKVVNSAHGVGTYMPFHSYDEFIFLIDHQKKYYSSAHKCVYKLRRLNIRHSSIIAGSNKYSQSKVLLVFLSQISASVTKIVSENEERVLKRLADEFGKVAAVELLYRPHPNNFNISFPTGFDLLRNLEAVNGHPGVVFVSFFSTCYIDPNFVGHKILLRGDLIYPNLIFGDDANILNLDDLVAYTRNRME